MKGEFVMEKDVRDFGEVFYNQICDMLESDTIDPRYKAFIARLQTHYHKIAIAISAATRDDRILDMHCAETAKALTLNVYSKLPMVYNLIGQSKEVQQHTLILRAFDLAGRKFLTEDQLFSVVQKQMSHWNFKNALASVIASRELGKKQQGTDLFYFRRDCP
jgi:hypothetical protein